MKIKHLEYGVFSGIENMAEDWRLLEISENQGISFFRCYGWCAPAITIGHHQKIDNTINIQFCQNKKIDIIKRPTGGKAIFHNNDFTFAVILNKNIAIENLTLQNAYALVNTALFQTLKKFSCAIEIIEKSFDRNKIKDPICFNYSYNHEIIANDKKLVGIAQRRLKNAALIQGNIHLTIDFDLYAKIFYTDKEPLKSKFCALSEILDLSNFDILKFEKVFFEKFREMLDYKRNK
ncbi:MAG TPA: biotin/lipoate A/B protein ligase family protein [bacterium]|nr:biotin/lipoate A/B protein ligase family protein [bacterium]HPP86567.1 biotin/lipoate A/B protein ligase family protein [bacterium]